MSGVRLASIVVGGAAQPWVAMGFATDAGGRIPFHNGALEFTGHGRGLHGITITGRDGLPADIEGIPVTAGELSAPIAHPNGAFELDHLVVMTDSLERTSDAVTAAIGTDLRRIRETDVVRQGFHRIGPRGCIVEIVERADVRRVGLFGLVITVVDLDAVVDAHERDTIGTARDAVQPGRRIATARSEAGLGTAVAFMSPNV